MAGTSRPHEGSTTMRSTARRLLSMTFGALLLSSAGAFGDDESAREGRLGADLFVAGGSVTVREPVGGDLFSAGGALDVDAAVGGDAVAAGGKVRVGANVGQSVYAAAGQLNLNGKVGRNARLAGGQIELGPKAEVAGNLSAAGGQVRLYGAVHGHVQTAGGRVLIDGPVGGDVVATSGHVELGPNARIGGKLRYRSGDTLHRDPAAVVSGGVEGLLPSWGDSEPAAPHPRMRQRMFGAIGWIWTLGLVLLAGVLLAAAPRLCARLSASLHARTGLSLLLGFVWLVCAPVAVLVLLLTIIGIPLALLAAALYLAVLPVAYVATAIAIGDWALQKWRAAAAAALTWRVLAAAVVLVALALLARLPWLGGLAAFSALLAGLGAMLLQFGRRAAVAA
jgi:cytoskeletal protein CcmA (bactofilin family)